MPCSAVMSTAEHLDDEQVVHNRMYRIVPDPTLGQVRRRAIRSRSAANRSTPTICRARRSVRALPRLGPREAVLHVDLARGSPSTCSATTSRCTANVPPPTVSAGANR